MILLLNPYLRKGVRLQEARKYLICTCLGAVKAQAHSYPFCRAQGSLLSIYKDTNAGMSSTLQSEVPKLENKSWHCLGARAERNKENQAIPSKWTSNKVNLSPESFYVQ